MINLDKSTGQKKQDRGKHPSDSNQHASRGLKRPWTRNKKSDLVEQELFKIIKNIDEAIHEESRTTEKVEDENTLFCTSLVAKFKRIPEKYR